MRVAIGRENGKACDSRAIKQMIILIERDAVFEFILNRKMKVALGSDLADGDG